MTAQTPKKLPPLFEVDGVLVSSDIVTECFCCDLGACGGACCIEGESGAPLLPEEVAELEAALDAVWPELSASAQAVIERQGVAYTDADGDLVTSIVRGKDCVFTCYGDDGCCYCAVERCWRRGQTRWVKPISCALYPIREARLGSGLVALNYHRWSVCRPAIEQGRRLRLPVYRFLRQPLERRFGQAWYAELADTVQALAASGYEGVIV